MDTSVEATRNNNNIGSKFLNHWEEKVITSILVFIVSKLAQNILITFKLIYDFASFPSNVDVEIFSFSFSYKFCAHVLLVGVERETITSMKRNVKNLIVIIESFLGTISVMYIPIENANSLALVSGVLSCDGNIIKNTKTRRVPTLCVVARRTNYTIATLKPISIVVLLKNCLYALQGSMYCEARCDIALVAVVNIVCLVGNC